MIRRIQELRLGLDERRDPFDQHADLIGQQYLFLYLTGRGESSYLLPPTAEGDILDAAARAIPVGSTQIWVLEWVSATGPDSRQKIRPSHRRAAEALRQDRVQQGRSYILIGENGQSFGWADTLQRAIDASTVLADEHATRIAIGLLKTNITWH